MIKGFNKIDECRKSFIRRWGDDVSWTPAWVEGAVQTALNAIWGIVHHLGGATAPTNPGPGDAWNALGPISLGG